MISIYLLQFFGDFCGCQLNKDLDSISAFQNHGYLSGGRLPANQPLAAIVTSSLEEKAIPLNGEPMPLALNNQNRVLKMRPRPDPDLRQVGTVKKNLEFWNGKPHVGEVRKTSKCKLIQSKSNLECKARRVS